MLGIPTWVVAGHKCVVGHECAVNHEHARGKTGGELDILESESTLPKRRLFQFAYTFLKGAPTCAGVVGHHCHQCRCTRQIVRAGTPLCPPSSLERGSFNLC